MAPPFFNKYFLFSCHLEIDHSPDFLKKNCMRRDFLIKGGFKSIAHNRKPIHR